MTFPVQFPPKYKPSRQALDIPLSQAQALQARYRWDAAFDICAFVSQGSVFFEGHKQG